jgi:hypothetical protein
VFEVEFNHKKDIPNFIMASAVERLSDVKNIKGLQKGRPMRAAK